MAMWGFAQQAAPPRAPPAATDDAGLPKMHQANQMEIKGE